MYLLVRSAVPVRSRSCRCGAMGLAMIQAAAASARARYFSFSTAASRERPERPRRSLFSVPGADARKIAKAKTIGADAVVLDLEDGVAFDKKDAARELVRETLTKSNNDDDDDDDKNNNNSFGESELCVRINALDTKDLALRDLEAVLPCKRLEAVVIPKVETASDIHFVSRMIDAYCCCSGDNRDVRIIAAVESALGILNLREIAATIQENHPLDALVFASEDYCANVEAVRTEHATELLYPRSQLVTTAKAYGLQAIDMVHINFRDLDGLRQECLMGRQLGMTGKQAIHPAQVDVIHESFSPSPTEVEFAAKVVEAYEATTAAGKGACVVDGIVVDMPVYKWAVKITKRAESAGVVQQTVKL